METFLAQYRKDLQDQQAKKTIPNFNIDNYLLKIRLCLKQRTMGFDHKSPAIKQTCKTLKIKNTYKDIFHFIDNHE